MELPNFSWHVHHWHCLPEQSPSSYPVQSIKYYRVPQDIWQSKIARYIISLAWTITTVGDWGWWLMGSGWTGFNRNTWTTVWILEAYRSSPHPAQWGAVEAISVSPEVPDGCPLNDKYRARYRAAPRPQRSASLQTLWRKSCTISNIDWAGSKKGVVEAPTQNSSILTSEEEWSYSGTEPAPRTWPLMGQNKSNFNETTGRRTIQILQENLHERCKTRGVTTSSKSGRD